MTRIAVIGEPLVELCQAGDTPGVFRRQLGGDTLNTAVYLARLLKGRANISYVTRLGDDPLSDWILGELRTESVDTSAISRVPGLVPGLSMIETDDNGERSFTYWRNNSPARQLLADTDSPEEQALSCDLLFFSGVTLAVVSEAARARLISIARALSEAGGTVVFDTNYRPILWETVDIARAAMREALRAATLVMPSSEDLQHLHGLASLSGDEAIAILRDLTTAELIVKTGGGPACHCLADRVTRFDLDRSGPRVDTTGAGDSFNAGFLAARLSGHDIDAAIHFAHRLASRVVAHRGAVIPTTEMVDLNLSPQRAEAV